MNTLENEGWCWWRGGAWAHMIGIGVSWEPLPLKRFFFLFTSWSRENGILSYENSTWQPAGLKCKLRQNWGPAFISSGFYSLCPVQWNLTCFRGELNYGPISKYHIFPFEVAYVMESGRCHVLKLLPNSFALIYCARCSWILKTVAALSVLTAARLTAFFTLPKCQNYFQSPFDFIWPPAGVAYPSKKRERRVRYSGKIGFECFVTMVDNFTSWWILCSWVIWRCI